MIHFGELSHNSISENTKDKSKMDSTNLLSISKRSRDIEIEIDWLVDLKIKKIMIVIEYNHSLL